MKDTPVEDERVHYEPLQSGAVRLTFPGLRLYLTLEEAIGLIGMEGGTIGLLPGQGWVVGGDHESLWARADTWSEAVTEALRTLALIGPDVQVVDKGHAIT